MALGGILALAATNILLDYVYTYLQNSSFYLSESLLFSSYWLLYCPFLVCFLHWIKTTERLVSRWLMAGILVLVHLMVYPAVVWVLSLIFYDHTFAYFQTFSFALSAYFIKTVLIYGFAISFYLYRNRVRISSTAKIEVPSYLNIILVTDLNQQKVSLAVKDIIYFSSNSPYVNIHHTSKKYLFGETLKSLQQQLNSDLFVRVHKSHIVNLQMVASYQSRQNGDYDLSLSNGEVIRISRNYAADFKSKLEKYTRHRVE